MAPEAMGETDVAGDIEMAQEAALQGWRSRRSVDRNHNQDRRWGPAGRSTREALGAVLRSTRSEAGACTWRVS
jgi:hypothetical protein